MYVAGEVALAVAADFHRFGKSLLPTLPPDRRRAQTGDGANFSTADYPLRGNAGRERLLPNKATIFHEAQSPATIPDCRRLPRAWLMCQQKLMKNVELNLGPFFKIHLHGAYARRQKPKLLAFSCKIELSPERKFSYRNAEGSKHLMCECNERFICPRRAPKHIAGPDHE